MRNLLSKLLRSARRLAQERKGVAAVEFALILPLLLTLYIGTIEGSRALSYDRRLTSAASALGDLVAQTKSSLTLTELNDIFVAAEITVSPFTATTLEQVVTCVFVDADGNAIVNWSYGHNGGTAHSTGAAYDLPVEFTDVARDTYVIISEARMDYTPLTGFIFPEGFTLYKEHYYVPRFGEYIDVTGV